MQQRLLSRLAKTTTGCCGVARRAQITSATNRISASSAERNTAFTKKSIELRYFHRRQRPRSELVTMRGQTGIESSPYCSQ